MGSGVCSPDHVGVSPSEMRSNPFPCAPTASTCSPTTNTHTFSTRRRSVSSVLTMTSHLSVQQLTHLNTLVTQRTEECA